MFSITLNEGNVEKVEIVGSIEEIAANAICAITIIYEFLKKKDENVAKDFKVIMNGAFNDGIVFCTEEERKEILKKKKIKQINNIIKKLFFDPDKDEEDDE